MVCKYCCLAYEAPCYLVMETLLCVLEANPDLEYFQMTMTRLNTINLILLRLCCINPLMLVSC